MLLLGRLSPTIVWPALNAASALPPLMTWRVQVQLWPSVVAPATLLDLDMVKSGAVTVTESLKSLLFSLLSVTTSLGSTEAKPPERGLAKMPVVVGVAVKVMSKLPPG